MLGPGTHVPSLLPRTNAILVGLEPDPVGANQKAWIPVVPSQAHLAFQQALADLPPGGGVLYVLPGTAPYVFGQSVTIDKPDTVLSFAGGPRASGGGSYLTFPPSGGPPQLLRIAAPRVRVEGARVRYAATNDAGAGTSDDGRSVLLVDDADDAALLSCTFDLQQANPPGTPDLVDFACLRALGATATDPRQGLRVHRCTFLLRPGTRQGLGSSAGGPHGVTALHARHQAGLLVTASVFRGTQDAPRGSSGPMIVLEGCPGSVLADLVFRALDVVPSTRGAPSEPLVRVAAHGGQEGHRTVVARVSFEGNDTRTALELVDTRADVVSAASFGRLLPHCEAALTVSGSAGRGLAVSGVNLHNVSAAATQAGTSRLISLQRIHDVTLAGNVLVATKPLQEPLEFAAGQCANAQVEAWQALQQP